MPIAQANALGSLNALSRHDIVHGLTGMPLVVFGDEGGQHVWLPSPPAPADRNRPGPWDPRFMTGTIEGPDPGSAGGGMDVAMVRRIGLWVSEERPDLPAPQALVDARWDDDEREDVASYLSHGTVARAYLGFSTCRICGVSTNSNLELTDGVFLWPQGLAHYVCEHSVRLPSDIIGHARERLQKIESAIVDESWWREATSM